MNDIKIISGVGMFLWFIWNITRNIIFAKKRDEREISSIFKALKTTIIFAAFILGLIIILNLLNGVTSLSIMYIFIIAIISCFCFVQDRSGGIYINSNYSNKATIAAPGYEIPVLSINLKGKLVVKKDNGTSVATAQISALVALALDINNKISQKDLIFDFKNSIDKTKFINTIALVKNLKIRK